MWIVAGRVTYLLKSGCVFHYSRDIYSAGNKDRLQQLIMEKKKHEQDHAELEEEWLITSEELEKIDTDTGT